MFFAFVVFWLALNVQGVWGGDCPELELTEMTGIITSPEYNSRSRKYPPQMDCVWFRDGNYSLHTQIKILELDIEPGPNGSNLSCNYDNLLVAVESTPSGFRFCGDFAPHEMWEGQGNLKITFTSDDSTQFRGFKLQYNFTENFTQCEPDPCLNGGLCAENVYGFYCRCPDFFDGRRCEREIPPCELTACLNGGSCTDVMETRAFTCHCDLKYWSGRFCEFEMGCVNPGLEEGERKYFNGDQLRFKCEDGYAVFGNDLILCQDDNSWDLDQLPICKLIPIRKRWTRTMTVIISSLTSCLFVVFLLFAWAIFKEPTPEDDVISNISEVTSQYSWPSNFAVYNFEI